MIRKITLISFTVILSGCVAVPKKEGIGSISEKHLSFPKNNQKTYVVAGGLVHLKTAYKSGYRFKLKNHFSKSVQLGMANINVGINQDLRPSILDEQEHHCATVDSYRDLMGFNKKDVCFLEENGKFVTLRYAPGSYWFKSELIPPLETIKTEIVTESFNSYTKKELIYNGSTNKTLMFIEKEYGNDLQKPLKMRPVNVRLEENSEIIEISGSKIKVFEYNANSMTFAIEKSFD